MDPEHIKEIVGIGLFIPTIGVIAYGIIKYGMAPIVSSVTGKDKYDTVKNLVQTYERAYTNTIEQRAKLTAELANLGKSKVEISDYLETALPIPEVPDADDLYGNKKEEEKELAPVKA